MRPLTSQEILEVWEKGQNLHPLDRALLMLQTVCSGMTWDELSALPVADRDTMLFDLYEKTFGATLGGFAQCPGCSELLEFDMSAKDIHGKVERKPGRNEYVLDMSETGIELTFRLPTSLDLAAIIDCGDVQKGRAVLARRCIVEAKKNNVSIPVSSLAPEVFDRLAGRMEEETPGAEVIIDLQCPACGRSQQMALDILVFLWSGISSRARRLIGEVHVLASVYKWREKDILSLSPARRRYYLDMVS